MTTAMLPLKGRTTRIRTLCPITYLVREDFFFGMVEGFVPQDKEDHHHSEAIHQRMKEQVLPNSVTILSYDLIRGQPLPWMKAKGWTQGYVYILFYCVGQDRFLEECVQRMVFWLYGVFRTSEQERARVLPDQDQYQALRQLVQDSLHDRDVQDRAATSPVHTPDPLPPFIIRRRGEGEQPPPVPVPVPQKKAQVQREEPDEARNFLIKERELMNLISGWRGRER